jgi:hypothetical protein
VQTKLGSRALCPAYNAYEELYAIIISDCTVAAPYSEWYIMPDLHIFAWDVKGLFYEPAMKVQYFIFLQVQLEQEDRFAKRGVRCFEGMRLMGFSCH